MNLENIPSEISQRQKRTPQVFYDFTYINYIYNRQIHKDSKDQMLSDIGGRENEKLLLHGYGDSLWIEEKKWK